MRLDLANHFTAAAIGIQDLREERPERVFATEQAPAAESTGGMLGKVARRDELLKKSTQLMERMCLDPGSFVCPLLPG